MENRFKFHKKSWSLLKEHLVENNVMPPKQNYSDLFMGILQGLNPILRKLQKLDSKFPPRPDMSTVLETSEFQSIVDGFEALAKQCHNKMCDRLAIVKLFGSLTKRLGDYWNVISEHASNVAGIDEPIIELANLVQKVRKEFRRA
jgi:hypothetical protein